MSASWPAFKIGSRSSRLALVQADEATATLRRMLPALDFEGMSCSSPGDRDKTADLRRSDPDFFTRDLHEAVRTGKVDCAVHSAKDLEDPISTGMDWFWLPSPADPRDVVVLRRGETLDDLRGDGIVGVSSERREEYCRRHFPRLQFKGIRGTIEERLAKLDAGEYDVVIMAAAALLRLGLEARISKWISVKDLPPPDGQGHLALTFRAGDERFLRIRSLFVKPVIFAGAGSGSAEACTRGAWDALARCDVCFHDRLIDPALLKRLPQHAPRVDVGKQCGDHGAKQAEINERISAAARRGRRVVRLKGGDPGVFGRLAEEIGTLDALHLPYRVIPGVSSLNAATTGTGMLLTRRGVSRGFTVMTPRQQDGGIGSVQAAARAVLPMAFFMATGVLEELVAQLLADGLPETTPAALVFDAGTTEQTVIRGSLADIADKALPTGRTGLVIVGSPVAGGYHSEWGALMGRRVWLPCSEALQKESTDAVRSWGGIPIPLSLIRMVPDPACIPVLKTVGEFDWLVATSPSSVEMLMQLLPKARRDVRCLPKILVAGPGTARAFKRHGIVPEAMPARCFGADGVVEAAAQSLPPGATILRLRSQRAGPGLSQALARAGFRVTDAILYANETLRPERIPAFDAVFLASASAAEAFADQVPPNSLAGRSVVAIGKPTQAALEARGIPVACTPQEATVASAIQALASVVVQTELEKLI